MNKWRDRFLVGFAIVISVLIWGVMETWAVTFPVQLEIPDGTASQVVIQRYAFSTLVAADTVLNCDSLNRSYNLGLDTVWMVNLLITPSSGDLPYSYTLLANYRFSSGTISFRPPVYLDEYVDSIRVVQLVTGAQTSTDKRAGPIVDYDTTYSVQQNNQYTFNYHIWFAGDDEPTDMTWLYFSDTTGGSGGTQIVGSLEYAVVYATLYQNDGQVMNGAVLQCTRAGANNTTALAGSTKVIIAPQAVSRPTDANGYVALNILRSNQYGTGASGKYNFKATYNNELVFEINGVTIPSTGNVNLADSIAARRQ